MANRRLLGRRQTHAWTHRHTKGSALTRTGLLAKQDNSGAGKGDRARLRARQLHMSSCPGPLQCEGRACPQGLRVGVQLQKSQEFWKPKTDSG